MRILETEYAGCLFRSCPAARWAVFFDAVRADWEYEPCERILDDGMGCLPDFQVRGVRLWTSSGMSVADIAVVVRGVGDPASEAKVKAYAEERPILVLGYLPHGPNYIAGLTYGLGGGGAVALLEPDARRFVVPGVDDDGRFALFDADWPALAYLESRSTREAYAKAVMSQLELGQAPGPAKLELPEAPINPLDGLSGKELKAIRGVARQGFASIGDGTRFRRDFLAETGLTTVPHDTSFALVVRDEKAFAPFREAMEPALESGAALSAGEMKVIRAILDSPRKRSAPDGFVNVRDVPLGVRPDELGLVRKRISMGRDEKGRQVKISAWMPAPSGPERERWLSVAELAAGADPGTQADGRNPKKEDES